MYKGKEGKIKKEQEGTGMRKKSRERRNTYDQRKRKQE